MKAVDFRNYLLMRFNDYEVPVQMSAEEVRSLISSFYEDYQGEVKKISNSSFTRRSKNASHHRELLGELKNKVNEIVERLELWICSKCNKRKVTDSITIPISYINYYENTRRD